MQYNWHTKYSLFSFDICIYSLNYHHKQDTEHFHQPHTFSSASLQFISPSTPFPDRYWSAFCHYVFVFSIVLYKWTQYSIYFKNLDFSTEHDDFEIYQCCMYKYFIAFCCLLCMDIPYIFFYSFICWWTVGLFLLYGYYKQLLQTRAGLLVGSVFIFWINI